MNKRDIAAFFDSRASTWDDNTVRNEQVIAAILDNCHITAGTRVLDVACGTGVLFGDYLSRGAVVTGVDISPRMVSIAAEKFPNVRVICADVDEGGIDGTFDCVMVYNAFPHFPDPISTIESLSRMCRPGGRLSIAHGISREAVIAHHRGAAAGVSLGLMEENDLAALLESRFTVETVISDQRMYQVTGVKKC